MDKKVLVGTFIRNSHVPQKVLKEIVESFNTNRIFIFNIDDEIHKRLITFNVNEMEFNDKFLEFKKNNKNTVRLHRHKDSNTFYTINSLNKLVYIQNGTHNNEFSVKWDEYKNCCLLVDKEGQFKAIKTKLAKVVEY